MSTFKEPVKLIGSLLLVMCIGACSAETSEEMQGVLRDANHALSDAKQSIEDSGILDTSKEMLEEAKEKAAGVLPEELAKLMDPSVYLEAIGEDNLETIKAMGEGAGALLSTVRAESYEDIYNDYAEKLRREGGKLLEEYQKEATLTEWKGSQRLPMRRCRSSQKSMRRAPRPWPLSCTQRIRKAMGHISPGPKSYMLYTVKRVRRFTVPISLPSEDKL